MPTLHRLATIRDDIIYFIALYQAWIYRVDYRRVNEFGQGGDDEVIVDDQTKEKIDELKEAEVEVEVEAAMQDIPKKASAGASASGTEKKGGGKKRK